MHLASEKCDIFRKPLFCLILHNVSLPTVESSKSTSRNFSAIILAKKLLHVTEDTDCYRILQRSDCKLLRKIMEMEKHILADLVPLRQPYATEKLRGRPSPTNPVGFQNFNIFSDCCLRKEGL